MPGQHALLSPSASSRWLYCTAAPRLEADEPNRDTDFTKEGTLAHAYCALKLKEFLKLNTEGEKKEIESLNAEYHSGEMDEHTDTYKICVLEKFLKAKQRTSDAKLLVETKLDFTKYVPESFGTADAIIITDGTMEVIDFKYGKGVEVSAVENSQMMIYALGALEAFDSEYLINKVRMTIIQPRLGNFSEYELSTEELKDWAKRILVPRAFLAFSGKGEQLPGTWCKFCKVKGKCKALTDKCLNIFDSVDKQLVTKQDIEERVLPNLELVKMWVEYMEQYTLEQALSGVEFEGYKVVEGRSNRKITDTDSVVKGLLEKGYSEKDFMKPATLETITNLEKLIGKKAFSEAFSGFIEKPKGKPTLVKSSDKRPVYNNAADDFKDINF